MAERIERARPRRAVILIVFLAGGVLALGIGWNLWNHRPAETPVVDSETAVAEPDLPLPPLASSPFLNTTPDVAYVGSESCERCHPDTHQSYHATAMSRSAAKVSPGDEPEDSKFNHERSGRRYSIYRQEGALRQREILTDVAELGDVILADHAVEYVVGSGHFSKTYLSEVDGFLVEAPASWFSSHRGWDVSPGYDQAQPDGFERAATENCMTCHVGRIEMADGSLHRIEIKELAIGCERCHGPGALHVEKWKEASASDVRAREKRSQDETIVNPAHLPRELAEAVCQQCHLTSTAQVAARGRRLSEFRPGLPLQDYFLSFRRKDPGSSMTVVGHVDQLALSKCYQKSNTLTCLTCHNPHDVPGPEERVEYYRSVCLQCHQQDDCHVDPEVRNRESPENHCAQCHMPGAPTEIVHLAFTHHRIGIHRERPEEPDRHAGAHDHDHADGHDRAHGTASMIELEPVHDLSRLDEIDRDRALGLAYLDLALDPVPQAEEWLKRSEALLLSVRDRGMRDAVVDASLAQVLSRRQDPRAIKLAREALSDPRLAGVPRIWSLVILASDHFRQKQPDQAIPLLDELVTLRRSSTDFILRGYCELARDNEAEAIRAMETALSINPKYIPVHRELYQLYMKAGDQKSANRHRRIAERLRDIGQAAGAAPGHEHDHQHGP